MRTAQYGNDKPSNKVKFIIEPKFKLKTLAHNGGSNGRVTRISPSFEGINNAERQYIIIESGSRFLGVPVVRRININTATGYLELEPGWTGNCVGTHTFFPGFKLSEFWTVEEIKKIPNRCYSGEPDCITVGPCSQGTDSLQVDVSYDYSPAGFDLRAWIYVIVKGPIGVPLHIRHT